MAIAPITQYCPVCKKKTVHYYLYYCGECTTTKIAQEKQKGEDEWDEKPQKKN